MDRIFHPFDISIEASMLERVKVMRVIGDGAVRLLLDHGGWDKVAVWLEVGVNSKNVPLIEQSLRLLLEVPMGPKDVNPYKDFRLSHLVYNLYGKLKAPDMFGLNLEVSLELAEICAFVIIRFVIVYEQKVAHYNEQNFDRKLGLTKGDMKEVIVQPIKDWDPKWVFVAVDGEGVSLMTWERMGPAAFNQVNIKVNENERLVFLN